MAIREAIRHADQDQLAEMASIVAEMVASSAVSITPQVAAELDVRFHQALLESTGHKRLIRTWMDLRPQIHLFLLSRTVANPDFREHLVRSHTDILNSIKDRDEARGLAIIDDHLKGAYVRVMNSYPPK